MALRASGTLIYHRRTLLPTSTAGSRVSCPIADRFLTSSTFNYRRPSHLLTPNLSARPGRCCAASGRSPPPESGPPSGKDPNQSAGPAATLARLQETAQIFFAVFFWMSLFFWASAWDGRNNGKSDKGSRF